MFNDLTYDELNSQNTTIKSMDIEQYYEEMEISEEQKKDREELAENLQERYLFVLILIFTMLQYIDDVSQMDWNYIRIQFEVAYRQALDDTGIDIDDYLDLAIREFADDVTQSTIDNVEDPYYYTEDRARFMAENESSNVESYLDFAKAVADGKTMKEWGDMKDNRERETHREVGGTKIPINDLFHVGDSLMRFPHDLSLNPSPEEIINCRCWTVYT